MKTIQISIEIFDDLKFNSILYNELLRSLREELTKGNEVELYDVYIEGHTTRKKFGRYKFAKLDTFEKWLDKKDKHLL